MDRPVIIFDENFPEHLQEEVLPYFEELAPFFCREIDTLRITFKDLDGPEAEIEHSDRHREARVFLSMKWLAHDEEDRWDIVAHELAHLIVNQLTIRVADLIDWFEQNSNQNLGFARKTIMASEELVVSDIGRAVLDLYLGEDRCTSS